LVKTFLQEVIDKMLRDLSQLPKNLPVPVDDGACAHLTGAKVPSISLKATKGPYIDLSNTPHRTVVYCYPRTGRPNAPLPEGWDEIPGARGCTPQSCSFNNLHNEYKSLGVSVFGLSTNPTEYQEEAYERLKLTFHLLSDSDFKLTRALNLPTFTVPSLNNIELLKRVTLVLKDGIIEKVFYPVFPTDTNAQEVLNWLKAQK